VDAGAVDPVIIAKLDRLTRSVKDLAEFLDQFNRRGVSLWVKANICSWRGGWSGNPRQKGGRQAPVPGGMNLADLHELGELPDLEIPD
jgi:hypothetical protein